MRMPFSSLLCRLSTLCIGACLAAQCAAGWEIPLAVENGSDQTGVFPVSGGVPLLAGQAMDTTKLRLASKDGVGKLTAVPAQFRVLARWWRGDNSIRWVLVDFATPLQAGETPLFYLTDNDLPAPAPAPSVRVTETPETFVVDTGAAQFTINRKQFALFDKVVVDNAVLIDNPAEGGSVIEDVAGTKYYAAAGTRSVELVDQGPLRVCVRAQGMHRGRDNQGYSRGMYEFDTFMNFRAGSAEVTLDHVIGNHPAVSRGSPTFEDASLVFRLAGGEPSYWIKGDSAQQGKLAAAESVCLYQDSNGADTWQSCQGYDGDQEDDGWNFPKNVTPSFRGFRVLRRAAGREEILVNGDLAKGLLRATTERGGVIVHTKNFWQQFPKAVEMAGDGRIRVGLFPREYRVPHFLEDTTAKGHEIVLSFFATGPNLTLTPLPSPEAVASRWDHVILPRPTPEHQGACGALADLGPFTPPTEGRSARPDTRVRIDSPRMFTDDDLYGNAFGWQTYGERWRSQGGSGRQGARQPMNEDDYLRRWYLTGVREWFEAGDARSRHFRDVRGYRIEGQDPYGFTNWMSFRAANMSENRMDRPQPKDAEAAKYSAGLWPRCAFWLPNPEHYVLDLLYDRYLLFGDVRSLENMRIIAAHGGYYAGYQTPVVTRDRGWGWRTLFRYWELTGDRNAERLMTQVTTQQMPLIGQTPLISGTPDNVNWWFTTIYTRAAAMAALHTRDPRLLDLLKSLAVGKEKHGGTVSTLYAVLYHLTGDASYKEIVLNPDRRPPALSVGGYLFICDHWLLNQPPRPLSPPPAAR